MILSASVIAPLLAMAINLSGLPLPAGAPPPVVTIGPEEEHDKGGKLGWNVGQAVGVTNLRTGHIRLYDGWTLGDNDTCVLVHELTHYLQVVNHVDRSSMSRLEWQAWEVTVRCYEARGEADRANWSRRQQAIYGSSEE